MKFLLSYPRSGNTFFRYCIEYITQYKTNGCGNDRGLKTLGILQDNKIKNDDVFITKRHFTHQTRGDGLYIKTSVNSNNVLLLVRNYKYCVHSQITRGAKKKPKNQIIEYCKNINTFYNGKNIIYYEDFIKNPKESVKYALDFFEVEYDNERFENLFNNIEEHKEICLKGYKKNQGKIVQQMPDRQKRKIWDDMIKNNIDEDKISVVERYFEENLENEEKAKADFVTSKPPIPESERRARQKRILGY